MYILADKLLGPNPRIVPPPVEVSRRDLQPARAELDLFGNALVELENIIPDLVRAARRRPSCPATGELSASTSASRRTRRCSTTGNASPTGCSRSGTARTSTASKALALFAPPIDPESGAGGRRRARHLGDPRRYQRAAAGVSLPGDGPQGDGACGRGARARQRAASALEKKDAEAVPVSATSRSRSSRRCASQGDGNRTVKARSMKSSGPARSR